MGNRAARGWPLDPERVLLDFSGHHRASSVFCRLAVCVCSRCCILQAQASGYILTTTAKKYVRSTTSQFTHNERTTQVNGGAAVPCRARECHGIYNHTQTETRWFNFNVALAREATHGQTGDATDLGETDPRAPRGWACPLFPRINFLLCVADAFARCRSPNMACKHRRLPTGRFDRSLLEPHVNAHGGKGEILFRQIWGPRDFRSNISHLHHLLLPPVRTIGTLLFIFSGLHVAHAFGVTTFVLKVLCWRVQSRILRLATLSGRALKKCLSS